MGKANSREEQQTIQFLRDRLNWFMYEASEEEYDEKQVSAILDLLKAMNPVENDEELFTPDKALDRFWKSYEMREKIEREFEKLKAGEVSLADYPDDEDVETEAATVTAAVTGNRENAKEKTDLHPDAKDTGKKTKKRGAFLSRKAMSRVAVAAALVVAVFVGGTAGAYAEKEGFFHWIQKDDERITMVVDTIDVSNYEDGGYEKYSTYSELPEKYRDILWTPENIPHELVLEYIGVYHGNVETITGRYKEKESDIFCKITSNIYGGNVIEADQVFDSFSLLFEKIINNVDVTYLEKINDDYTEYVATFFINNNQYIINGNVELSIIEGIVEEYINKLN